MPDEAQEEELAGTIEEEGAEAKLEESLEEKATEETVEAEEAPAPAEEEEAKPPEKKKKEEEEIVEERIYTIPLGKAWVRPPNKRAPRAMHMIRAFVNRHMKLTMRVEEEEERELPKLVISKEVNEKVWGRGIEKPPRKIRVRAAKDKDGNVTVHLAEES
ncbi:MAG TPA: 50S ribosomal protein L31e [Candidatus Bathyarchaeia archaeon]|nr:50S ribosomal protein L31e [Candidatus Bathyarchaeia archaeon]